MKLTEKEIIRQLKVIVKDELDYCEWESKEISEDIEYLLAKKDKDVFDFKELITMINGSFYNIFYINDDQEIVYKGFTTQEYSKYKKLWNKIDDENKI